ncbi:MAG: AAA family ATPase, partial [Anaerolineales bacterium]
MTTKPLTLFLFGAPRLERDGRPLQMDTRKAIALLAYLALNDQPFRRDTLAAVFWPNLDQSRARAALRRTLTPLNKALGSDALLATRETIALNPDYPLWVDARVFQRRVAEPRAHGHSETEACARCREPFAEAVRLYRDDFMAGFTLRNSGEFDEWQFFQAEALRRDLSRALERLVQLDTAASNFDKAIEHARRWLALDSLHEPAHRSLMQLYAASGQRTAALRQYRTCVRILDDELGVPPLEETTALYERILEQRTTAAERPQTTAGRRRPVVSRQPSQLPVVGRETEFAALLGVYSAARQDGQLVVIEGEAGIGKTRLAKALVDHARQAGAAVVSARCFEGETGFAYGPLVTALRALINTLRATDGAAQLPPPLRSEASRLLPELADGPDAIPAPAPLDSPGAQSRFYESIRQLLGVLASGDPPGVLFFDDLNWADAATLDLLTYLIRRLAGQRLLVLATWRSELVPVDHRLREMVSEARRAARGLEVSLGRLSVADVQALVEQAIDAVDARQEIAARLYAETEGVPFFVVEFLRAVQADSLSLGSPDWTVPNTVRDLLQSRLAHLSAAGSQLLSTAAVIGRSFSFDVLQAASGRSGEETIGGLEQALARGLIAEVAGGEAGGALVYDFNHEQMRKLVYEQTSLARRRLLHRRVAAALARRSGNHARIARHYQQAADEPRAAEHFLLAADQSRAAYANLEALEHYQAALALGHPDSARLHEAIADVQTLLGDYLAAVRHYETAAAHLETDEAALARIEHKLGAVYLRSGGWDLAESHFQSALEMYERQERTPDQARLRVDWSQAAHRRGDAARAQELARAALALAEQGGDPHGLAQAYNMLGILAKHAGDDEAARTHLQRSRALAEELDVAAARIAALNNLALVYGAGGEPEAALELAEEALRL